MGISASGREFSFGAVFFGLCVKYVTTRLKSRRNVAFCPPEWIESEIQDATIIQFSVNLGNSVFFWEGKSMVAY